MNVTVSMRGLRTRSRRHGLRATAARGLSRVFRIPLILMAAQVVRRRVHDLSSLDAALDFAYQFSFGGVVFAPWQERSEIRALLAMLADTRPRAIVEIGTSNGGSLFLFARVAAPDAVLVSVDLPHGEFGGGYPPWRGRLYKAFASENQRIELLRADSHRPETLEVVRAALGDRSVDLLFVDGDHTYDGVKRDYEIYETLMRSGGLIAFHDIVPSRAGGPRPRGDYALDGGAVAEFWSELRETHDVLELVEDWESGRFGIGVIRVLRGAS